MKREDGLGDRCSSGESGTYEGLTLSDRLGRVIDIGDDAGGRFEMWLAIVGGIVFGVAMAGLASYGIQRLAVYFFETAT